MFIRDERELDRLMERVEREIEKYKCDYGEFVWQGAQGDHSGPDHSHVDHDVLVMVEH